MEGAEVVPETSDAFLQDKKQSQHESRNFASTFQIQSWNFSAAEVQVSFCLNSYSALQWKKKNKTKKVGHNHFRGLSVFPDVCPFQQDVLWRSAILWVGTKYLTAQIIMA